MQKVKHVPVTSPTVYYQTDGSGRDSYIRTNNGGLCDKVVWKMHPVPRRQSRFISTRHPGYRHSNDLPAAPIKHYISDGSGRDFYISVNQGGNSTVGSWRDETDFKFKASLRDHEPIQYRKFDIYLENQGKFRTNSITTRARRTFSDIQKERDNALSRPRPQRFPAPIETYYQCGMRGKSIACS